MLKKGLSMSFLLGISFLFFSKAVECASYRLIPENFLSIGNRWEYQIHVTIYEGSSVNWWGTRVLEVTRNEDVSGFNAAVLQNVLTIPGVGSETEWMYWYLSSENLVEVRWEDDDEYEVVINNDPWEIMPIWVSDTDSSRHVGHGQYAGHMKISPYYEWSGYNDYFITYERNETVTVPAGTFNCVVVSLNSEWHDDSGWYGNDNITLYFNPTVGIVKFEEEEYHWDNDEKVWCNDIVATMELSSTNFQPGQTSGEAIVVDSIFETNGILTISGHLENVNTIPDYIGADDPIGQCCTAYFAQLDQQGHFIKV